MKELMVCVQVDCKCPFSPDWLYYPKNIVGIHRIKADDSRAKVGELWAKGKEYCHGTWYSQGCENENCNPSGEVVNILFVGRGDITGEITKEGIKFNIVEGKPYFVSDERRTVVVSFDPNKQIPLPPREKPYHYSGTWIYWIPQRNQWVGFDFSAYQERNVGPLEEDLDGPYLILNETPPTEEEVAKAVEKGKLVEKIIDR